MCLGKITVCVPMWVCVTGVQGHLTVWMGDITNCHDVSNDVVVVISLFCLCLPPFLLIFGISFYVFAENSENHIIAFWNVKHDAHTHTFHKCQNNLAFWSKHQIKVHALLWSGFPLGCILLSINKSCLDRMYPAPSHYKSTVCMLRYFWVILQSIQSETMSKLPTNKQST